MSGAGSRKEPEGAHPSRPATPAPGLETELLREMSGTVESINDYISLVTDTEGRVVYISPVVEQLLGVPALELIGRPFQELVHEQDRRMVRAMILRVLAGEHEPSEFRLMRGEGGACWVRATCRAMRRGESLIGLRGVLADITRRKQAEEKIRRVHEVFFPLMRRTNHLIVHEKDRRRLLEGVCHSLTGICGYSGTWIALSEKPGQVFLAGGEARGRVHSRTLKCFCHDRAPACLERLAGKQPLGRTLDSACCASCQVRPVVGSSQVLGVRLEYGSIAFGAMFALLPPELLQDSDERNLFQDVAEQVSFAIYNMELEEYRARAEEALRGYQKAVESSDEMLSVVDRSYVYLLANEAFTRFRGLRRGQVLGRTMREVMGGKFFREVLKASVDQCLQGHKIQFEMRSPYPGPEEQYLSLSFYPLIDPREEISGAVSVIKDISARKLAERKLQYRYELERLVAAISARFINLDPDGFDRELRQALAQIGEFSEVDYCVLFTLSRDEREVECRYEWRARGRRPFPVRFRRLPVERLDWILQRMRGFEQVSATCLEDLPEEAGLEREIIRTLGLSSMILVPLGYGRTLAGALGLGCRKAGRSWREDDLVFLKMVGEIFSNAMEHKRNQEALKKAREGLEQRVRERTAALLESEQQLMRRVKELTCQYDLRREFDRSISLEETLQACLGHIRDACPEAERKWAELVLDGQRYASNPEGVPEGDPLEHEVRIGNKPRGVLRVHGAGEGNWELPLERELLGEISQTLSAYIQRRELKEHLTLSEKLAATGRVAAGVAHEINNPLGAVKNSLYIIKRAVPADHPDYEYVELMDREIGRVSGIISQLYGLYRPAEQESRLFQLSQVVESVLKMLEAKIRSLKIRIDRADCEPEPRLKLPVSQVTQVLYNIIENAVQSMPGGGILRLACQDQRELLRLSIGDTGQGIPPEVLPHIFEPFFTTKAKRGSVSGGMGMGLSISNSLMESMGGRIGVESRPGEGTTVHLDFPFYRPGRKKTARKTGGGARRSPQPFGG